MGKRDAELAVAGGVLGGVAALIAWLFAIDRQLKRAQRHGMG